MNDAAARFKIIQRTKLTAPAMATQHDCNLRPPVRPRYLRSRNVMLTVDINKQNQWLKLRFRKSSRVGCQSLRTDRASPPPGQSQVIEETEIERLVIQALLTTWTALEENIDAIRMKIEALARRHSVEMPQASTDAD
jgi:ribosomal protein L35